MAGFRVQIELGFSPFVCKWGLASLVLLACAPELGSENVTLSTYYPAPSGVYAQMLTTSNTYLARDGGKVGIGTSNPQAKVDIVGKLKISGNLVLNDRDFPAPVQTTLSWENLTLPGKPATATYGSFSGCSYWYTSDTCGNVNNADTCAPADDKTCLDLVDSGCSWGYRIGRTVTCTPETAPRNVVVLTAH